MAYAFLCNQVDLQFYLNNQNGNLGQSFRNNNFPLPVQLTQIDDSNFQLNNTVLYEPLVLINCSNAQIENITIANLTDSTLTAISLENCPNSILKNITISNITATNSYASGITITNSYNTSILNTTIKSVFSTASSFYSSKVAYGIVIEDSPDVYIFNLKLDNLNAISTCYGIYSEDSTSIIINNTSISQLSSKSSYGIYFENSSSSEIYANSITNLVATTKSSGIKVNNSLISIVSLNNITNIIGSSLVKGIEVTNSPSISIKNNTVESLSTSSFLNIIAGIDVINCNYALIKNNSINTIEAENYIAIGISTHTSNELRVLNNTIEHITSSVDSVYGILVDKCPVSNITGNKLLTIWSSSDAYNIPPNPNEITGYAIYIKEASSSSISWNIINNSKVWIYADETSNNLAYFNNFVDSIKSKMHEFRRPINQTIEETQESIIQWNVTSLCSSFNYTIYRNGEIYKNSTNLFYSNFSLNLDINNLPIGISDFLLMLQEDNGLIITDFVQISVYESNPPQFTATPDPTLYYQVGSTQEYLLWWTVDDVNPATYTVYQNGTEIAYGEWKALIPFNVSVGGLSLGIYNITIQIQDLVGNTISNYVYVHVIPLGSITITRNTASSIEYEIDAGICTLNWTVHSIEGGTYSIYRGPSKDEKLFSASFEPEEPIIYVIPVNIPIGTHIYTLQIFALGNTAENSVSVKVVSNPTIGENTTNQSSFTAPPYTIPPYLSIPEPEFPWNLIIGLAGGLGLAGTLFFVLTKRILVPKSIKQNRSALKKARKINDKNEEANRLQKLGETFMEMKDYNSAIKHNKAALKIYHRLGDKSGQLTSLIALGDVYLTKGVEKKSD